MVASTHAMPVASPHDAPAQVVGQAASGFNLGASMISRLRFNRQKRQEESLNIKGKEGIEGLLYGTHTMAAKGR